MDDITNNHIKWTREQELSLVRDISHGTPLGTLAIKYTRSIKSIETRLGKIIYENIIKGRNVSNIARSLNLSEDKVNEYLELYKNIIVKHNGVVKECPNIKHTHTHIEPTHVEHTEHTEPTINTNYPNAKEKLEKALSKLEFQNKIMNLIVDNKNLNEKLNDLIKTGKVDASIKLILKKIKEDNL